MASSPKIYNNPKPDYKWHDMLQYRNVYDREPVKVYSNIATQSFHMYVGNSNEKFVPIKYFRTNFCDNRCWIEFYRSLSYNTPVYLPEKTITSFSIDLQFLPFDKSTVLSRSGIH